MVLKLDDMPDASKDTFDVSKSKLPVIQNSV